MRRVIEWGVADGGGIDDRKLAMTRIAVDDKRAIDEKNQ
jgi:hypothetical protein